MVAGSSLQVRGSQNLTSSIGNLAVSRVGILATADGELHGTVDNNSQRHVAIAVTVTALCTAKGGTCRQGRGVELAAQLLVGNLEVLEGDGLDRLGCSFCHIIGRTGSNFNLVIIQHYDAGNVVCLAFFKHNVSLELVVIDNAIRSIR